MKVDWQRLRDQALVAVCVVVLLWAAGQVLGHALRILVLVLLATVLAYALEPPIVFLQRFLPRVVAALGLYLLVFGVAAALLVLFGHQLGTEATSLVRQLPAYLDQTGRHVQAVATGLGIPVGPPQSVSGQISHYVQGGLLNLVYTSANVAAAGAGAVIDVVVVLVMAFYFMVDGHRIGDLAVHLVPPAHREKATFVRAAVGQVLGSYIRGQLILAGIIGIAAGTGSWLLGVRYPLVIGLLAFLFELVPMLGPVLSAVPAVIIALFQPWPLVIWVVLYFVAIQMIENHILAPRISGHAVGLHPVVALLALLAGADLFGIWGALFAVPITGIAAVLATALYKAWRGQPIVVERGRMKLRLPRRQSRHGIAG
ncbi:MAG TPA: AI-2E family transporter [Candidatus Dormibacteraeota bacterium]